MKQMSVREEFPGQRETGKDRWPEVFARVAAGPLVSVGSSGARSFAH